MSILDRDEMNDTTTEDLDEYEEALGQHNSESNPWSMLVSVLEWLSVPAFVYLVFYEVPKFMGWIAP